MEAYWFLVGLLGFLVNLLLTLGANLLAGHPPEWKRLILAGLLGGIHAGCCVFPRFAFLADIHWRLMSIVFLTATAFRWDAAGLLCGVLFLLMRLALDELATGGIWHIILFGALILLLCRFGGGGKEKYVTVSMEHRGKCVELTALLDTGNTLTDPVSGKRVIVVGCDVASILLGLDQQSLERPLKTMTACKVSGLRLIPYTAVGMPSGMLLGLRVDSLRINGKPSECIVAFAPQKIGQGKNFQALAGGSI